MNEEYNEDQNNQEDISNNIKKLKSFLNDLIPKLNMPLMNIDEIEGRNRKIEILNQHYGLTIEESEELLENNLQGIFVKFCIKKLPIKLLLDAFFEFPKLLGESINSVNDTINKLLLAFENKVFTEEQIHFCFILAGKKPNATIEEIIDYIKNDNYSFELHKGLNPQKPEIEVDVASGINFTKVVDNDLMNIYDNISEKQTTEKTFSNTNIGKKTKNEVTIQSDLEKKDETKIFIISKSSNIGFTIGKEGNNYILSIFKDKKLLVATGVPKNVKESQLRFIFISNTKLKKIENRKEIVEKAIPLIRKEISQIR